MTARRYAAGFASLPMVTTVALMITMSLLVVFRAGMLNRDQAAKSQLRADYSQREEALLRALVAVFPQKAIACMKAGYEPSDDYSWNTIFAEAVAMASSSDSLPADLVSTLGYERARSANVADDSTAQVRSWISSLSGVEDTVTPGTTAYAAVFDAPAFAGKVPPLLDMSTALQEADEERPVVSPEKRYSTQGVGLLADVTKHPVYNLMAYPNIRFGYSTPGEPFVAKRNWWALTLSFGDRGQGKRKGVPVVAKHYVLSLYEVPTQLPIEGAALAEIGRHQGGVAWDASAISISGGVYADRVSMNGGFGTDRIAGRQSITIAEPMTLDGSLFGGDFDAPGVRESLQAERRSEILPVALSANSGRLAFLPVNRGPDFLTKAATSTDWETYSRGAERCRISVEAISMVSLEDQSPTAIRVRFQAAAGGTSEVVLQRGSNWPLQLEPGGDLIPFQTELTDNNHACLTFFPGLLNAWLTGHGGAQVTVNNSIRFGVDAAADPLTIKPVANPLTAEDMAVIVRKGIDLTAFTTGLSIVAPLRVYVGDDLNATPLVGPPAGSGLPYGTVYYPPMSIFSAELRIGTTAFNRPFEHHGQISTLANGSAVTWQPLDVKSGSDDAVHTDSIAAELKPLTSPAELPPVHQINWLVVLEEIPND